MPARVKKTVADVTELLHEDHQKVRELFFQFSKSEDAGEKESLVSKILTELYIHATVEEEIVYPALKDSEKGEELEEEAEIEHRMVKYLMAELANMTSTDEAFDARVTVLCELVDHHVKEEEKEMFKELRENGSDLEELAEQVAARKEELMDEPLPTMEASLKIGDQNEEEGEEEEEEEQEQVTKIKAKSARKVRAKQTSSKRKSA